jgi:tetratricopeptide (TPR) repeat protein
MPAMSDLAVPPPSSPEPRDPQDRQEPGKSRDREDALVARVLEALEGRPRARRAGGAPWVYRAMGNALKTEWKYLLIGLMIVVGHYKYHLSLLYYVHELAHTQQEHMALDEQRRSNGKLVKHHIELANMLFGEGEMREAESEYRLALKLDATNLEAQRGLFKASIFNQVDDDANPQSASPVVILSRIRELACEVQESQCLGRAPGTGDEAGQERALHDCETAEWECIRPRARDIPAAGPEGAHVKLLEGMALATVDPDASLEAYRRAIELADGHRPDDRVDAPAPAPTNLAAAYIRIGDHFLGDEQDGDLPRAIRNYQIALQVAPWNINALDSLGYALYRSGRLDEARERFGYLSRLDETLMVAHADLGRTLRCIGAGHDGQSAAMDDAYEEQHELLSLLTKTPPPATRDSTSQWQYPVKGRVFDLHEPALRLAYATCALCTTGHLRGLRAQIEPCLAALRSPTLTSYQRQTARDFLLVEMDELLAHRPQAARMRARVATFKAALAASPP